MKVLVTSDWHGDWFTDGFARIGDLAVGLEELLKVADTEGIDRFLFLGDLTNPYSTNVHHAVAAGVSVATYLSEKGVPNDWMVGNHDIVDSGSSTLIALAAINSGHTRVFEKPGVYPFGACELLALPYTSPAESYDPAEVVNSAEVSGKLVVAGHLNIEGITAGSETEDMPRGRDVFWPFEAIEERFPSATKLNGHYHEQQEFRGISIPGSLLRLTHGEEGNNPGYMVIEL